MKSINPCSTSIKKSRLPRTGRLFTFCLILAVPVSLFFSCTTEAGAKRPNDPGSVLTPPEKTAVKPTDPEEKPGTDETQRSILALRPIPENIMGRGLMEAKVMAEFLLAAAAKGEEDFVRSLAGYYVKEAAVEGINHDVAFAQMCLETGFLQYGGLVMPEWNNFCGLGAMSAEYPGERFPDALTGVRAHIQHLKAYASEEPLKQELVDPRYRYVRLGSSPKITGLAGTWASDKQYAEKINRILERLYQFSSESL